MKKFSLPFLLASATLLFTLLLTSCSMKQTLKIEDTTVGEGSAVQAGDTVKVHYTGTLDDGTKFDSSKDRGETFSFKVGAGQVIAGWDQGLVGMKVGGVRQLTIPPDLAYGDAGIPGVIPAKATLNFEIELVGIAE